MIAVQTQNLVHQIISKRSIILDESALRDFPTQYNQESIQMYLFFHNVSTLRWRKYVIPFSRKPGRLCPAYSITLMLMTWSPSKSQIIPVSSPAELKTDTCIAL